VTNNAGNSKIRWIDLTDESEEKEARTSASFLLKYAVLHIWIFLYDLTEGSICEQ
jgi:hypothetical protein